MAKKLRLVEVEWVDASISGGWGVRKEYLAIRGIKQCRTAGYLLRSNRKEIMVVQSQTEHDGVADSISIPRPSVQKIRYLEAKE